MKRKIWLMNHYATDMYKNQGGRHYWFAQYLINEGYDVKIFCANTFHNSTDYIDTKKSKFIQKTINKIPFVFVKTTVSISNGIDRIKNMLIFYMNLFPVTKKIIKIYGKPDVIIASSVHPLTLVAGIKIAKKLKVPCICEIRDLWPETIFMSGKLNERSFIGRLLKYGEYWIYKKSNQLIFTKEGDTDYIIEQKWDLANGGDIDLSKTHYINNGVDIDSYSEFIQKNEYIDIELESNTFNVIYVGAIRQINNVGNILDAAKTLISQEDIKFFIFGDGNQKKLLQKRIIEEDLHNVIIKGFVEKKYIPSILNKSNVNILNYSNTQYNWSRGNSSNKLFEYMASGKPIISTVKTGYSLINKYQCGIELEIGSFEELAEAILKIRNLKKSEYETLGNNAKIAAKDFDFKILTKKLIRVIDYLE